MRRQMSRMNLMDEPAYARDVRRVIAADQDDINAAGRAQPSEQPMTVFRGRELCRPGQNECLDQSGRYRRQAPPIRTRRRQAATGFQTVLPHPLLVQPIQQTLTIKVAGVRRAWIKRTKIRSRAPRPADDGADLCSLAALGKVGMWRVGNRGEIGRDLQHRVLAAATQQCPHQECVERVRRT